MTMLNDISNLNRLPTAQEFKFLEKQPRGKFTDNNGYTWNTYCTVQIIQSENTFKTRYCKCCESTIVRYHSGI